MILTIKFRKSKVNSKFKAFDIVANHQHKINKYKLGTFKASTDHFYIKDINLVFKLLKEGAKCTIKFAIYFKQYLINLNIPNNLEAQNFILNYKTYIK